jgi:hypothetical protein
LRAYRNPVHHPVQNPVHTKPHSSGIAASLQGLPAAIADLHDARLLDARLLYARLLDARLLDARRREASRYEASCHDAHGAPPCAFHILQAAAAFPRGAAT